jgi:hypothetical protein
MALISASQQMSNLFREIECLRGRVGLREMSFCSFGHVIPISGNGLK